MVAKSRNGAMKDRVGGTMTEIRILLKYGMVLGLLMRGIFAAISFCITYYLLVNSHAA